MRASKGEKIFYAANYAILTLCGIIALFPFLYIVSISVTPYVEVIRNGGFIIIPRQVSFEAYRQLLTETQLPHAFVNSVFITVVATFFGLLITIMAAFGLSKKSLYGRSTILLYFVFTMFFSGGMIPTYLVVKSLGLLDSYAILILVGMVSVFNLLIVKGFMEGLPAELEEAATMDGASEPGMLVRIILPLSKPVIATIGLFYAVNYWNMYFEAILYVRDASKLPLQPILQQMLATPDQADTINLSQYVPSETMKMAAVVITVIPVLLIYPFLQKHFTKGILLGSVKG
ncbi:carbohydrate ABC transporter permease [Paenibacillus oryzisoli]|uniref:carbohydrate ABC transporter permease n=1 Tax=Paenibacillus oryzisoli TaxID=1850517 RepID=UPI003D2879C0